MSISKKIEKVLTNKYFLYFIAFLSATNVFGYLVMNRVNAVIFFALVGMIMSRFSKNMSVVLLVCIVSTNLLMSNKMVREGLDGADHKVADATKDTDDTKDTDATKDTDSTKVEKQSTTAKLGKVMASALTDATSDKNPTADTVGFANQNELEPAPITSDQGKKGSRIDLAGSLKSQFAELQDILGPDGVKG